VFKEERSMSSYHVPRIWRIVFSFTLANVLACAAFGADSINILRSAPEKPAVKESAAVETATESPRELLPTKEGVQPAPLQMEIAPPAAKLKPQTEKPKILSFKPEADSSGMATRLRDSAAPGKTDHSETSGQASQMPPEKTAPESNANRPNEELQPIAPEENPDADASRGATPAAPPSGEGKPAPDGGAITPIPDDEQSVPASLEAASFNGVTPGQTTIDDVEKAWGPPKEMFKQNEVMTQLYSIPPFDRIEVGYEKDKVASIIVRFQKPFPAKKIAQQLDMIAVKPVLVLNDLGEILGQSYPERGVLFAFESNGEKNKPSFKVTHIIIEPINAEPFILRAETEIEDRYDRSLQDLQIALDLQPENARANWLTARIYSAGEQFEKAEAAAAAAARLEPKNARYLITHAQILGQMGRLRDALQETQKAMDVAADQPHLQARALCLAGDLTASGPKPDFRKAIGYHAQALQAADKLARDEHPAVRKAAKEVLVDAHLGSAHDIAWGEWKDKEKAVGAWLKKAVALADDLMKSEDGTPEQLFRVHTRALSACVGIRSGVDPKPWVAEALRTGNELIASTKDPIRRTQYQWDLGMALYDAVQICQLRSDHAQAMKYGEAAVAYLESGHARKQTPTTGYLLGRLYFRLGAIHAIRDQDHAAAVAWFNRAVPLLEKPVPPEARTDVGRHGETFVSMGVSYWETGNHEQAVALTKEGIKFMEEAVRQGTLDRAALAVPYGNLAAMQKQLGDNEDAAKYSDMAARVKITKTR
jgi:tetratricopeptide (TPR) repeat protein